MKKLSILIARHGESEGNIRGDVTGGDPGLTEKGLQQAVELADILLSYEIEALYASDLLRAQQTANVLHERFGPDIVTTKSLRERHFGSVETLTHDDIIKQYGNAWNDFYTLPHAEQMVWKLTPDMESFDEVFFRVTSWLDEVAEKHTGTVVAVSHANVILTLLAHLGFAELSQLPRGSVQNTAFVRLEKIDGVWKIVETKGITRIARCKTVTQPTPS